MKDSQKNKILAVTGAQEIPFISEGVESSVTGYVLSEDAMTKVAETLESDETDAEALTTAQQRVTELEGQLQTSDAGKTKAEGELATANTRIKELEARVAELEEEPGIKHTSRSADEAGKTKVPFHLSKDNPMNKIADAAFGKPKEAEAE